MPGFDWNGNGNIDISDKYVDMQIINDNPLSEGKEDSRTGSFYCKSNNKTSSKDIKPLYNASKDSNTITILKCILSTALCIGGIALPIIADMGGIGTLICVFVCILASVLILNN